MSAKSVIKTIPATLADQPLIQHMWRFYVYDMGRYCGFNKGWECPISLSFVPDDLTHYFVGEDRRAFLINVGGELAGFVMLYKGGSLPDIDWKISEFYIISKYQGKGIGETAAKQIFKQFPGTLGLTVTPENRGALHFWRKVISRYTGGNFSEEIITVDYHTLNPKRILFRFNSEQKSEELVSAVIRPATVADIHEMVALSDQKRRKYEMAQPRFWRRAEEANETQTAWFTELLSNVNHILLVAEDEHHIKGFIIGELKVPPEVYDPGGLTLMIDDFCVENAEWDSGGKPLLHALQQQAIQKGVVQTLVVCGYHDEPKREFLKREGLSAVSEWYVGDLS